MSPAPQARIARATHHHASRSFRREPWATHASAARTGTALYVQRSSTEASHEPPTPVRIWQASTAKRAVARISGARNAQAARRAGARNPTRELAADRTIWSAYRQRGR